jgi:hypothetical protein
VIPSRQGKRLRHPDLAEELEEAKLRRLAEQGFKSVPVDQFGALARWCLNRCETTGDARFCFLHWMLQGIDEWWSDHDESGGIPVQLSQQLETVLLEELAGVLDASGSAEGSRRGARLLRRILPMLTGPNEWVELGWGKRGPVRPEDVP